MNDLGDTNCYVVIVAKEDQMCVLFGMPDAFLFQKLWVSSNVTWVRVSMEREAKQITYLFLRSVGDVLYVCAAVVVLVWQVKV